MQITHSSVLALDVGAKRIGVAVASLSARLARPLTTIANDENTLSRLDEIIADEFVERLVVGYPRGLQGQSTAQTRSVEDFCETLHSHFLLPIDMQDEALTSQKAEQELESRGRPYAKGDIDALAATYILDDFLNEHIELEGLKK